MTESHHNAKRPVTWLWNASAGIRWEVLLMLFANVLNGASGVALAWMLRDMIDSAVDRNLHRFFL